MSAPKVFLGFWVLVKNLSRCDTFYCCYNRLHCKRWYTLNEKMYMVNITSYFNKLYFISFANANAYFL